MEFSDFGAAVDDKDIVVLVDKVDVLGIIEDDEVGIDAVVTSIVVTLSSQAAVAINMKMAKLTISCILIKDNVVFSEVLEDNIQF